MTYAVRLEQFEGPLELLLQLIEKEKLDITRVSLAQVADQYLEYLEQESDLPLESLSRFLSVAARLILLKSRALLPLLFFTEEEEESIVDLEWQLREYQRYREAGIRLGQLLAARHQSYARERSVHMETGMFFPPEQLTALDLRQAFEAVLGDIPLFEKLEEIELQQIVRLEEKIAFFREALIERAETSFQAMTGQVNSRVELIVSFLALLQLIKDKFAVVEQKERFGNITIRQQL